ncbi:MAG: Hsp20/alpha crystallin family protein [Caldimonas sp.]
MEDYLPEFFRRLQSPFAFPDTPTGEIRIDVSENDKGYEVRADIPGASKDDIRVNVDGNFVSISAEVKREKEEKKADRVLVKETYRGRASRGFSLPHEIDSAGVVAKLEDGVLRLTLPKREGAGAKTIRVQ